MYVDGLSNAAGPVSHGLAEATAFSGLCMLPMDRFPQSRAHLVLKNLGAGSKVFRTQGHLRSTWTPKYVE